MRKGSKLVLVLLSILTIHLSINISIKISKSNNTSYEVSSIVYSKGKKDTKPPVIKLKGSKTIKIYVGNKYKEPGYKVTDNSGEKLAKKVKIKSNLNNKKVGTYTIKYSVSDSMGNKTTVKRTVKVVKKPISNKVKSITWTGNGIKVKGSVTKGTKKYKIKLFDQDKKIYLFSASADGNNYSSKVKLSNLNNGKYNIRLINGNHEYKLVDKLDEESKIVRSKIGNKLVTFVYDGTCPIIYIDDFKYEYDVLIDVGHGGTDTGATNKYIQEKTLNLEQSLYEKKRYEEHGLKVLMTRTTDKYGIGMESNNLTRLRRKAYAVGYYGVVSKIVYGNHHNSISNKKFSGYELILANQGTSDDYKVEYSIEKEWREIYPNLDNHTRIYGRNYDTDSILNKTKGQTYNIKNYYAMQRIPYELFKVFTVTYEGCYLSNINDYKWYINNWKRFSEIKIKNYVESIGVKYLKPNSNPVEE